MNRLFILFVLLFGIVSCKDSAHTHYKKDILGRWLVVKSELNHKPSKSMEGAFFAFDENSKVTTNVLEEEEVSYTIQENRIKMESAQPLELDITYMQHDSMLLEGNYSLYYIKLFLAKEK